MESDRPRSQNEILASALRLIRLYRRMKPAEVAEAMGMAKRSYEHFEAGKGKINLERIHRFAEATDSDPYAIIDCMALGSPEFAVRCADNKAMLALRVVTQEFDEEVGDAIMELDTRSIINAFTLLRQILRLLFLTLIIFGACFREMSSFVTTLANHT